jgi:XTP/dITP diphosphohydrolase
LSKPLVIGSANRKKALELAELLKGLSWDVKSLTDFPPVPECEEDGVTFEANAIKKARYYADQLGMACIADDSGLVVDALDGAPGVYSARYAGEPKSDERNMEKLLDELADTPWHERTARFICCAVFAEPGREPHLEMGTVEGHISMEPFGSGGFGYDPLFVPSGYEQTFGELAPKVKHTLSHRGQALAKLRAYLETLP